MTDIELIKERLPIEEVVASYITVEKAGKNFKARCPFHNEKTPSFFISPERGSFYCFGCGAKGDIFSFVEQFEGSDFKGALKLLAERAGVTLSHADSGNRDRREELLRVMEAATNFYVSKLGEEKSALAYLANRGLTEKTISVWRIGCAPSEWRTLYDYLRTQKFSDELIFSAGLSKKTDRGYYDTFRGRIMFPIMDTAGRVIAFSGRILVDDDKSPKYVNSPETELFDKSSVLYGLHTAKSAIREKNYAILVEGQFDLLLSHQAGFTNTVATSGTAMADTLSNRENHVTNLGLVSRLSKNLVLAYDGDSAGIKATMRAAKIALALGMDTKAVAIPAGKDPADIISESPAAWADILKTKEHVIFFIVEHLRKVYPDVRQFGRAVVAHVLPLVAEFESSVEAAHFIHELAKRTSIAEDDLRADLIRAKKSLAAPVGNQAKPLSVLKETPHEKLIGFYFYLSTIPESTSEEFKQKVTDILGVTECEALIAQYTPIKDSLIFEAEALYGDERVRGLTATELLARALEANHRQRLITLTHELEIAERENPEKTNEILADIKKTTDALEVAKRTRSET